MKTKPSDRKFINQIEKDVVDFLVGKIRGNLWPYLYGTPQDENDPVRGGILYNEMLENEEDYYLYKFEAQLFQSKGHLIASAIGSNATIIELGPGSEQSLRQKTLPFLRVCPQLSGYVGIDISQDFLNKGLQVIRSELPELSVSGTQQDFTKLESLPDVEKPVIFFKGSTIANMRQDEVPSFISQIGKLAGKNHSLLLVHDANQDEVSLMKAYNNKRMAVFMENIMFRIHRDVDTKGMIPNAFRYEPEWDPNTYDFKHILTATQPQKIHFNGEIVEIKEGQKLHTLSSFKYPIEVFQKLIGFAGYEPLECFRDRSNRMAAHLFQIKSDASF
ncbi:L-histidine N(alpha)-methyltransferase [Oscillatoria sp. HE19RPO]|uniref:L-histidine N(alpha)-methyltransferase n=1 Tax=Oscillatoria sp. HE19RPO TaxID=2954806 RepID=UPI0020C39284|nr:L-histidine N(alpha)-methyltransferase [Oscillatoria sp. HE19RPO]